MKQSLFDYSDAYILVSEAITIVALAAGGGNKSKMVTFKNCVQFNDCMSEINNKLEDNHKEMDIVLLMYNLVEYSDNDLKTSGNLWQCYRGEASLNNADAILDFTGFNQNNKLFQYKLKITGVTGFNDTSKLKWSHQNISVIFGELLKHFS